MIADIDTRSMVGFKKLGLAFENDLDAKDELCDVSKEVENGVRVSLGPEPRDEGKGQHEDDLQRANNDN
jgi:hypothetical protein